MKKLISIFVLAGWLFISASTQFVSASGPVSDSFQELSETTTPLFSARSPLPLVALIINQAVLILFSLSGLVLFAMIVTGGYQILTAVQDPGAADAGKKRITAGIVGYVLLISVYWIAQIVEVVFGIAILG